MIRQTFMGFCLMLMTYQGVSAETLVPYKWDTQPIQLSLPEGFEEEELTATSIYGYTENHEITVEVISDSKTLQLGKETFIKNEAKRYCFKKNTQVLSTQSGDYEVKYTYGETHGLGDMFIAMFSVPSQKKMYALYISMGSAPEKVGMEILNSLK